MPQDFVVHPSADEIGACKETLAVFLGAQSSGGVSNEIVVILTAHADLIGAGMGDPGPLAGVPALINQMLSSSEPNGHFCHSGSGTAESLSRRRLLIMDLMAQGLE